MRYDAESGKINITCKELVSVARRRISSAVPYDEDEPRFDSVPKRELDIALEGTDAQKLYLDFISFDVAFELCCVPDGVREGEIVMIRAGEFRKGAPTPEFKAQTAGEAYVCAYALAMISGADSVAVSITYFDPISSRRIKTAESVGIRKLCTFFERCIATVGCYARPEIERVSKRIPSMKSVKFPYGRMRDGQRELVRAVYRAASVGSRLFATAPTGTGKTAATLFPAIRALGEGRCDKVFYLTPKSTTAQAPKECIELLCERGADIRAIALSSKDHACINGHACAEGRKNCANSECNRLAEAVIDLYDKGIRVVTLPQLREVAAQFSVCPHELELSYAELCDVVVCDFNYLFDPTAYIRRFFDDGGNYLFLVDEAHNLPDRAREMYSAEISTSALLGVPVLDPLPEGCELRVSAQESSLALRELMLPYVKDELRDNGEGVLVGAQHTTEPPSALFPLLERLIAAAEAQTISELAKRDDMREVRLKALREYLRSVKRFYDALIRFDNSYELFIFSEGDELRVKVFCLDTGGAISKRLSKGSAAVFFSATLVPMEYYRAVLGGERTSEMLEVASPFDPSQLSISVIDKISTRYSMREETLLAVCRTIAATVSARRGNYMIFSPSFAYSEQLYRIFSAKYPKIKTLLQGRNMTYRERTEFLDEFRKESSSYLIGFCVMGGIYSEGVDLVGDSLIGAVVVGIGIPSLSYEREAMSAYYDERYEAGKQYAYIYPGMNRVFQAAGRVIRREDDRGVVVLIDDRFADPIYKKSASDLFRDMRFIPDAKVLKETLESFWKKVDAERAEPDNCAENDN